ncbi:MAG: hypothetical protein Q9M09_03890 [Mariprofundaceae bacterium]|nr:hypothetical protein [Mariprofundaceae bacterium]
MTQNGNPSLRSLFSDSLLAARIESQAKPPNPPLLFSQQVAEQVEAVIPVAFVTSATLKGVSEAVSLYTVAASKEVT